jgi:hypothetical protein
LSREGAQSLEAMGEAQEQQLAEHINEKEKPSTGL